MRRQKPPFIRNQLDLKDRVQVRIIKRRLRLSDVELSNVVSKAGNSLAAISKEAGLQRKPAAPVECPPAAVIAELEAEKTSEYASAPPLSA
jgi:hypothetical protein